jgi:hypothetical protein
MVFFISNSPTFRATTPTTVVVCNILHYAVSRPVEKQHRFYRLQTHQSARWRLSLFIPPFLVKYCRSAPNLFDGAIWFRNNVPEFVVELLRRKNLFTNSAQANA